MQHELLLAAFIMAVGLAVSAAATHLYQGVTHQQAMLRFDGKTYLGTLGHLAMSFVCGPYIMLQLGWQQEKGGSVVVTSVLIASLVAFGWAFITGLLVMGIYVAIFR
jgi:hypothetical protein